jgi:hypothetical protein
MVFLVKLLCLAPSVGYVWEIASGNRPGGYSAGEWVCYKKPKHDVEQRAPSNYERMSYT